MKKDLKLWYVWHWLKEGHLGFIIASPYQSAFLLSSFGSELPPKWLLISKLLDAYISHANKAHSPFIVHSCFHSPYPLKDTVLIDCKIHSERYSFLVMKFKIYILFRKICKQISASKIHKNTNCTYYFMQHFSNHTSDLLLHYGSMETSTIKYRPGVKRAVKP